MYGDAMRGGPAIVGPILGLSLLVACGKGNANLHQPVTEGQRASVLHAVQGLREVLNQSPCGSNPDMIAEPLRKAWIERCRHIRETWGDWRSFGANDWYRAGNSYIAVEGIAAFTKGNCIVQVVWDLHSKPPRMVAFFLSSKEDQVCLPCMPPIPPQYMDPPPRRNRKAILG